MSSSTPTTPGPTTRSRARALALPAPAAPPIPPPPPPGPAPPPPPPAPVQVAIAAQIDFELLPAAARERVYDVLQAASSGSQGGVCVEIQHLGSMSRSLRADLKKRLWAIVVYEPASPSSSAIPRARDLGALKRLNDASALPIAELEINSLVAADLALLSHRTAARLALKASHNLFGLVQSLIRTSLRKLVLTDLTLACDMLERIVGQLSLSAIEVFGARRIRSNCTDDVADAHRVRQFALLPHLEVLELVDVCPALLDFIGQAPSLVTLILDSSTCTFGTRRVTSIIEALRTVQNLSFKTAGVGFDSALLIDGIAAGAAIPLKELLICGVLASDELERLPRALRQMPHLERLSLHGAGPYTAAFVGDLVDEAQGLGALSLVGGDGSGATHWPDEMALYTEELSRLTGLNFLCLDTEPPKGGRPPTRRDGRERFFCSTVGEACKALGELFLVTGSAEHGFVGRAARYEDDDEGDMVLKLHPFSFDEFAGAHIEWLESR